MEETIFSHLRTTVPPVGDANPQYTPGLGAAVEALAYCLATARAWVASGRGPVCPLIVSARQAEYLRVALYRELGFVGEDIAQLSLRQQIRSAAPYRGHLKRIKEISDLLSVISWEADTGRGVRIDMNAHGALALMVLQRDIGAELDVLLDTQGLQRRVTEKRIHELREFMVALEQPGK